MKMIHTTKLFICLLVITLSYSQYLTGNGSDGSLIVPEGEVYYVDNVRTIITGIHNAGSVEINLESSTGFSPGDEIIIATSIDPTRDFEANLVGQYEFNRIQSISETSVYLSFPLSHTFDASGEMIHQVVKVPNFLNVEINGTLTCNAWDGHTGGILAFRAANMVTISETGVIDATGTGYRGGWQYGSSHGGGQGGESYQGIGGYGGDYAYDNATEGSGGGGAAYANYSGRRGWAGGGGGGTGGSAGIGSPTRGGAGGGGGGHAGSAGGAGYGTPGFGGMGYGDQCAAEDGGDNTSGDGCVNYTGGGGGGGGSYGQQDLSLMYFGSGGGRGGVHSGYVPGIGGNGGGILYAAAGNFTVNGSIRTHGFDGGNGGTYCGGGGGGAGGSLFLSGYELELSGEITSSGGAAGVGYYGNSAGAGGDGIIRLDFNSTTLDSNSVIFPEPNYLQYPNGIVHISLSDTNDDTGPYVIEANVYSDNPVQSASVFYRVNSGNYQELSMISVNDTLYTASIPGQAVNSVVDYYIVADDGQTTYYSPEPAPASSYSFLITGFPPENLTLSDNHDLSVTLSWSPPALDQNLTGYSVYRSVIAGFNPGANNLIASGLTDTVYTDMGLDDFYTYYYAVSADYDYNGDQNSAYIDGSILVDDPDITTVLGYVYLASQSNHANIKIMFIPVSPSATLDSTFTNALGYFEKQINPGVYDISYSKSGYGLYQVITNQSIISDLDLGESTLHFLGNDNISGNISGIWDGTYTITGDVSIAYGDSLWILPGSEILFYGNYNFSVNGYLNATGSEGDSVVFRPINDLQIYSNGNWQGIDFNDQSDDSSILKFALVEYAVEGVYWNEANATLEDSRIHNCSGNGMYINGDSSDPVISRVITHHNTGNGFYVYNGDPELNFINSHHNTGNGGYYDHYSHGYTHHSKFNDNSSYGIRVHDYCYTNIDSSEVINNNNWGVRIDYSSPLIDNTVISHNSGYGIQYNIDNNTWSTPRISNCLVEENTSYGISLMYRSTSDSFIRNCIIRNNGSVGIYLYYDNDLEISGNIIFANHSYGIYFNDNHYNDPEIRKNQILYNWGDGIYKNNIGSPTIKFNTIYGNLGNGINMNYDNGTDIITHNIIVNNGGYGIVSNEPIEVLEYNLIYENLNAPISNLGNVPVDSWDFISFNANGDSADIYLNISEPVQFVFSDSTDLRLQPGSHAINAGDPFILDPDETVADIGALYFDFGNPTGLQTAGFGNSSVNLTWEPVNRDSLVSYNIYFKLSDSTTYTLTQSTIDTFATVSGLTNNELYDFSVSSVFPGSESVLSLPVSEKPGQPQLFIDPDAFNFQLDADTVNQILSFTNSGTRDLSIDLPLGMDSGSARFDGSGDYIHMANYSNHDVGSALTLECWIKRYNNGHFEFAGKHYLRYSMFINSDNHLGMYKGYDGSNNLYQAFWTNWELPENEWHHVAATWTGNVLKFYADGELIAEFDDAISDPIPGSGYNFQLGRRADYNGLYLNGNMAEVRLWNTVRTQEEIQRFMNSPLNGDEANLVGYWPLHNDYTDHSVYQRNGTNYGNTYISSDNPPTLPYLPFILTENQFNLAPGENTDAVFRFFDTGQTGTSVFTTPISTNMVDNPWQEFEISVTYSSQIPSTPVYFNPVASTGLPYTIVVANALLDDELIGIGDEIGIFDSDLCVGAGVFDGNFNFVLTAWEGDAGQGLSGFNPGDPIQFRIYDTSADLEATVEAEFTIGNGTFGYGQFSAVNLISTVFHIQEIPVEGGLFNLLSFNLLPRFTNAAIVFGDVDSLQIAYNDMGAAFIPDYGINTIGDVDFRDGFHLFSTANDTIYHEGIEIEPSEWDITVSANRWNSIAFLGNTSIDVTTVFPDTLVDSISIVQTFDGSVWIPGMGVNTLVNMIPGYGYQIALEGSTDITFAYQTGGGLARNGEAEIAETEHFQFIKTGIPFTIIADIPESEMQAWTTGDELGVFDGNVCVGGALYEGGNRLVVTAWQGDPQLDLPGFAIGNPMILKKFRHDFEDEIPVVFHIENDTYQFGINDFAHITALSDTGIPVTFSLSQNFPNPFNPTTNIRYELPQDTNVSLMVYTINGQLVKSLVNQVQKAGYYNVQWDGLNDQGVQVASGIYFYHIKAGRFEETHKMLMLK